MKKVVKVIMNILIVSLAILTVGILVIRMTGNNVNINSPIKLQRIATESMVPTLDVGDIVLCVNTKTEKLKVGDIISYQKDINNDGVMDSITHRIIEIELIDGVYYITTQGDNNSTPDNTFSEDLIIGKIVGNKKLTVVTFIYKILSNIYGFLILIILPLVVMLMKSIIELVVQNEKIKNGDIKAKDISMEIPTKKIEDTKKEEKKDEKQ